MAISPEKIVYDGFPSDPLGLTPFGFFDSESSFRTDAPKVANFVATRLGYPIMDVELQDLQIYACFEEAVVEYGKQVNQFRIRDNMYNLLGTSTTDDLTGKNIISTPLNQVVKLSKQYGAEALSGGEVNLKKGWFVISPNTQSYDLKTLWGDVSESGKAMEIRKIYHMRSPAVSRYYDPFAATGLGLTNLMAEFGFDGFSPAVTFVMMPAYEDILRLQAIEINDQLRKSLYSFTIANNKIYLSPIVRETDTVYFDYYVVDEKSTTLQSGSKNQYVSDISNVNLNNILYGDINSTGRMWIYKYTLALAKETLGLIRSKYETVPIPEREIRLDGELLRREATEEKDLLIKELQETLDKSGFYEQMKRQFEIQDAQTKMLAGIPLPIFIK